jgi:hypothetical protein
MGPKECDDRIRADIGYSKPQSRKLTAYQLYPRVDEEEAYLE